MRKVLKTGKQTLKNNSSKEEINKSNHKKLWKRYKNNIKREKKKNSKKILTKRKQILMNENQNMEIEVVGKS